MVQVYWIYLVQERTAQLLSADAHETHAVHCCHSCRAEVLQRVVDKSGTVVGKAQRDDAPVVFVVESSLQWASDHAVALF